MVVPRKGNTEELCLLGYRDNLYHCFAACDPVDSSHFKVWCRGSARTERNPIGFECSPRLLVFAASGIGGGVARRPSCAADSVRPDPPRTTTGRTHVIRLLSVVDAPPVERWKKRRNPDWQGDGGPSAATSTRHDFRGGRDARPTTRTETGCSHAPRPAGRAARPLSERPER